MEFVILLEAVRRDGADAVADRDEYRDSQRLEQLHASGARMIYSLPSDSGDVLVQLAEFQELADRLTTDDRTYEVSVIRHPGLAIILPRDVPVLEDMRRQGWAGAGPSHPAAYHAYEASAEGDGSKEGAAEIFH